MRIGLISGEFPPMEGGVGAFTQQLAQAIAASGHEVHVITQREARPEPASGRRYTLGQLREPVDLQYATLHPIGRRWSFGDVGRIAEVALRYGDEELGSIWTREGRFPTATEIDDPVGWAARVLL